MPTPKQNQAVLDFNPACLSFKCVKTFGQILESADALSVDEQESLISVLQRRLREQRRGELIKAVEEARRQFKSGQIKPASVAEIMRRILP